MVQRIGLIKAATAAIRKVAGDHLAQYRKQICFPAAQRTKTEREGEKKTAVLLGRIVFDV